MEKYTNPKLKQIGICICSICLVIACVIICAYRIRAGDGLNETTTIQEQTTNVIETKTTQEMTTQEITTTTSPTIIATDDNNCDYNEDYEEDYENDNNNSNNNDDDYYYDDYSENALYSANEFCYNGVIYWNGYRWTWYSQRVLPGEGLNIPGRYVDENGYICDENDYICLASSTLSYGTVISTPFGKQGKIYDSGCEVGTVDVYVDW